MNTNTELLIIIAVTLISILGVLSFKGNDSDEQSILKNEQNDKQKRPTFDPEQFLNQGEGHN